MNQHRYISKQEGVTDPPMEKQVRYSNVKFSPEIIKSVESSFPDDTKHVRWDNFKIGRHDESWEFDSANEFFAEYRKDFVTASVNVTAFASKYEGTGMLRMLVYVRISVAWGATEISIHASNRDQIERTASIFDAARTESAVLIPESSPSEPPKPVIFIGHGRSRQWRDLKDHLSDHHGLPVEAYETGARSGHVIRDILQEMLNKASLALLVLTAEDEQSDGSLRPRENVVHETGLFQGTLGFSRAIVLVEQGVEPFSNLDGIQQIRFSTENIRETFGDVLATIRREFPGNL